MQSYWFSKQSKINIIYNISVITITITMSIILANFGKYAISDCPFICLFVCLLATIQRNAWTGFHDIFRIGPVWSMEHSGTFCGSLFHAWNVPCYECFRRDIRSQWYIFPLSNFCFYSVLLLSLTQDFRAMLKTLYMYAQTFLSNISLTMHLLCRHVLIPAPIIAYISNIILSSVPIKPCCHITKVGWYCYEASKSFKFNFVLMW